MNQFHTMCGKISNLFVLKKWNIKKKLRKEDREKL